MKIIEVINTMITYSDKISNVIKTNSEYFFLYNKKYKWSITDVDGNFFLHLYPDENISLEELSSIEDWLQYTSFITYKTTDFKTREATESFSELYQIISSKVFGVDEILDDILKDI